MNKPEFSRLFPSEKLRDRPMQERIEATEEECAALAQRLDIVAIKHFAADLALQRARGGTVVEAAGTLEADVVYTCVVTLEPFESHIRDRFTSYFARPDQIPKPENEDVEDERAPEPIGPGGEIDLGELAAQHLSLALDPYPRKPGAVFNPPRLEEPAPSPKKNPFIVLAGLKEEKDGKKDSKKNENKK